MENHQNRVSAQRCNPTGFIAQKTPGLATLDRTSCGPVGKQMFSDTPSLFNVWLLLGPVIWLCCSGVNGHFTDVTINE